jgi:autotransporter-associated beta strand protein
MIHPNKCLSGLLRLILLFVATAFALTGRAANWYVATNGSDSAAGTLAAPLQTISKGFSKAGAGDTIQIRGGTYRESISLVGKSGNAGNPITLTSYTNETAILSGLDVQSLTWTTNSGISNIWVATYTGGTFEQMFVDGKPMLEARWPNVPMDTNGNWNFFSSNCWATVDTNGNSYGTVSDAHLAATGWNITGWRAVLNVSHQYYTWTRVVTNHTAGSAIFNYPQDLSGVSLTESFNDDRYYLVGNTNLLDSPGEWCYDANSQRLYFYPFNGKNPNTSTVEIKTRNFAFTADKNSKYLTIDGITFFGTAFEFGTSVDNRSANIIFRNNQILYSSWTEWLDMTNGDPHAASDNNFPQIYADSSQVNNNIFAYGALNAVFFYGWTNRVENNVFHDFDLSSSLVYPPLQFGRSWQYDIGKNGQGIARFNTLYNSGGILALIGGTNNDFSQNDLNNAFRACWGGNKDTSALYFTPQAGSGAETNFINNRFHHNWVHEGYSGAANPPWGGGIGIRGDDQTSGLTVDHNVTWNQGGCGIQIKNVTNPIPALANACINNTVFNYHTLYTTTNGAIYIGNEAGGNENTLSSVANNLADSIYGNWGAIARGTLALYASNSIGMVTETNLENIAWYDFRPQAGASSVLNQGVSFFPTTTNWVGSAPDIGAYERGDTIYFIPGQRATNATFPIMPDGAVGVPVTRDVLMWRPAYNAASHTIYFGTVSNALTSYGTVSGETNVFTLPALAANTNYYWRIDAVLTNSTVITGAVWSFSTWPNSTNWDGGGADTNWSTLANWNPDGLPATDGSAILTFSGTTRTNNYNNFATNTSFAGLNFLNTTAGQSFTLSGNPITLGGNIVTTVAGGTINDSSSIPMILNGDRTIIANTNHNLTLSGTLSDDSAFTPRSLIKAGAATLNLSGTNTFSGAVAINAGTLAVNSIGALGNASLITLGGGNSANLSYTGPTGNPILSIAVTLTGTGQSFINCASGPTLTYNGKFTGLTNATLYFQNTGTILWQSDVTNAGTTVTFAGGGNLTFSGAIKTGTAGVAQQWTGTTTLNNDANSFSGAVTVTAGTLNFTSITNTGIASSLGAWGSSGLITMGGGSTDGVLNYQGTLAGGHSTDRTIKIGNTSAATGNARINANGAGPLVWTKTPLNPTQTGWTNHTLTLGGVNTGANEIKGVIQDQTAGTGFVSLIKTDPGTWILSGTNTYTGATTVSNGTLLVNGSLTNASAVTVNTNATLGGSGTIGGVVTFNSGSHALFTNGASLKFTNSLIIATGGTLPAVILNLSNNVPAGTYTLATYNASGSSGAFNALVAATNSGSFAANTTNYITTAGGQVNLNVLNLYTLNYAAGANGTLSGSTSQTVPYLSSGTQVTAIPDTGYHFSVWSDGVLTSNRTDRAMVGGTNVIASFALTIPSPVCLTNSIVNGNQLVLNWPAGGWLLQSNSVSLADSNSWYNVTGATPPFTNTINPETPALFYRLEH